MAQAGVFEWNVSLLDDDVDGSVDLGSLIRTSRGSGLELLRTGALTTAVVARPTTATTNWTLHRRNHD
jgi:hypothetical protein